MSQHTAAIRWERKDADFLKGRYSREHTWSFDGGLTIPASSSPSNVPAPWSNPADIDPEEAFVAAVSSCHMLTFLFLAYRQGFQVDRYEDQAIGVVEKNQNGYGWVSRIELHPRIAYGGARTPSAVEEEQLHHASHEQCFIANSVKTEIDVQAARDD